MNPPSPYPLLTKDAIQKYVDCVLGEDPFTSIHNQCQTFECLSEKLTNHRELRNNIVYISLFVHRFVEFVGLQMQQKQNSKSKSVMVVTTQYVLLSMLDGWHYAVHPLQTDPTQNPHAIGLCHVEITHPTNKVWKYKYGSILLVTQDEDAVIIPFDGIVGEISKDVPWHRIMGRPQKPYNKVRMLNTNNPMLSLLWLHAIMHMEGSVMDTMSGPMEELNGMALYELQMADLLIPKGNIHDIFKEYEDERLRVCRNLMFIPLSEPPPPVTDRKQS